MKALHVWERIFHYVKIWLFVLAVVVIAYSLFSVAGLIVWDGEAIVTDGFDALELEGVSAGEYVAAAATAMASLPLLLVVGAGFFWMLEHIFKKVQVIKARGCKCECQDCAGDDQVEKIMKWKDFYNEGIITEREFIQKRNEILGLHK